MKDIRSKALIVLITSLMLAGCGTTPVEIKKHGVKESYVVNESYQHVYKTIKQNGDECWAVFIGTAGSTVTGEMYTDIKEAEVFVTGHGIFGSDTFARFDIRSIGDKKTSVTLYHLNGADHFYKVSQSWFHGNKGCETN